VNVSSGEVSGSVLALDQGMILAAIANALADNAMQHAFSDGAIEEAIRPLIAPEEFTAGPRATDGARGGPDHHDH
jgi:2-methylcitrate dehydratase PrpD